MRSDGGKEEEREKEDRVLADGTRRGRRIYKVEGSGDVNRGRRNRDAMLVDSATIDGPVDF